MGGGRAGEMGIMGVLGEMLSLRDKNERDRSHLAQAVRLRLPPVRG